MEFYCKLIFIFIHRHFLFTCYCKDLVPTSFSMPNLGNVDVFELHCWQKTWPQARQWCRRTISENATLHLNKSNKTLRLVTWLKHLQFKMSNIFLVLIFDIYNIDRVLLVDNILMNASYYKWCYDLKNW